MIESELARFLEGGCALIVGTVGADGVPSATRGWGAVVGADANSLRLLLSARDDSTIANLNATGAIAVTGADVRTLSSVQLKGRARIVGPATARDLGVMRRYTDLFFGDVEETDGTPRVVLDRLVPADFVACIVEVETLFDQTPGPGAGAPLEGSRS